MAVLEQVAVATDEYTRSSHLKAMPRDGLVSPWAIRIAADEAALLGALAIVGVSVANHVYLVLCLAGLALAGTYRRRISLSALDEAPRLLLPMASSLMLVGTSAMFVDLPSTIFVQSLLSFSGVMVGRSLSYAVIRAARRQGRLSERTLIVGAGAIGIELHKLIGEHPEYGLMSVGIVDDVRSEEGLPLVGTLDELEDIVTMYGVRRVIVAFGPTGEQDMIATLRAAAFLDLDVHVVPRFFELGLAPVGPDIEQIWGIPVYRVRRAALRAGVWKVKRAADVVLSAGALFVLAPMLGFLALVVRLSSPGPILFRQVRIGQHGRKIEVLKFRTLRVNVDSDITWSVDEDPRQTLVGRWLRRLSLDELPQLWNVLRGDMSLVGPRPERPHFVNRFSSQVVGYEHRHRLPVGLTGLAQVHGLRGDTSIEERARFDNFYIEHWSPWQDVKIVVRTIASVLRDASSVGRRQGDAGEREEQARLLAASVAARPRGSRPRVVPNKRR
jgi:exopolysaccharide biosynthesis polyprenyl glycosylphosphotransferase